MTAGKGTIAVGGALAQRPGYGGHAWVFLQFLLGFRRLGWEVLFLDRLEPDWLPANGRAAHDLAKSEQARWLVATLESAGLGGTYSLALGGGSATVGLTRAEALARMADSALLLNVMGFVDDDEFLAAAPRRVFLDIDPGFPQMWRELGLADPFAGHDVFVTVGENVGRPGCGVPTCGLEWITTRQPVVLEHWPATAGGRAGFTGIATWRGPNAPVERNGTTYGLRVHEFRRLATLPRASGHAFELALDIDPADERDVELLLAGGWRLVDPRVAAGDPAAYRRYIQQSRAECAVAKNMYVETNGGWFSDRSACYLASGKPVLVQDTGIGERYPTGTGLITYRTLDEAVAGAEEIERDYDRHARAARELAEDLFDSDKVLGALLSSLDAG